MRTLSKRQVQICIPNIPVVVSASSTTAGASQQHVRQLKPLFEFLSMVYRNVVECGRIDGVQLIRTDVSIFTSNATTHGLRMQLCLHFDSCGPPSNGA